MSGLAPYGVVAGLLSVPLVGALVFFGSGASDALPAAAGMACAPPSAVVPAPAGDRASSVSLTAAQVDQARTIVVQSKTLGLGQQAAGVAIMVAQQESGLRNLANERVPESLLFPHEGLGRDADSVNAFQQRPSQGWGSVAQLMEPVYAARAFLTRLAAVPGWESMQAWQAGQAVQASADGTLYQRWQDLGRGVAAALFTAPEGARGGLTCTSMGLGGALPVPDSRLAGAVIAYASAQIGKPYRWGGTGPDAYDCSGLVFMAFASAGVDLPRTAEYQIDVGYPVEQDQLQPGDLVFFNPGEQIAGRPGHVGIALGDGLMLDAPHTGAFVRIEPIEGFGTYMGARRISTATRING